jgi:sugar phosphate isomerase/epimerase
MSANQFSTFLSRRNFLKSSAFSAAALCASPAVFAADTGQKAIPVGVQLYCVRKLAEKQFPQTIEGIAKMGYVGVEFAGFYNLKAEDIRKILDDNGLKCCGSHTQNDTLMPDKIDTTIEFNAIIGNKYLIVPWLAPETHKTKEDWVKEAHRFNELAEKVKPHGMLVGYHNHAHEFVAVDGETPWDIFAQNTNTEVILQLDTGNAMTGGAQPVTFLERYPGRAVTIHLKEFSKTNKKALLGEGDIDFQRIFDFCETKGGTEWYIIEEEKEAYPPMVAIEKSLKNYMKMREKGEKKEKV